MASHPSSICDLPCQLLRHIVQRLDNCSRIALCSTAKCFNTAANSSWFKALTVSWVQDSFSLPGGPEGPTLAWPKLAPKPRSVVLQEARRVTEIGAHPNVKLLIKFLQRKDAQKLFGEVTQLCLKNWVLTSRFSHRPFEVLSLLAATFPSLTCLKLERCSAFDLLLSKIPQYLPQLVHLEVHNAHPDFQSNSPPTLLPATNLTSITSLSLITPHTFEASMDISPIADLAQLQHLELALPTLRLTGLGAISHSCTQLTSLVYATSVIKSVKASWEDVTWPSLLEAEVMCPAELLSDLGLFSPTTSPQLQRLLHLHCVCGALSGIYCREMCIKAAGMIASNADRLAYLHNPPLLDQHSISPPPSDMSSSNSSSTSQSPAVPSSPDVSAHCGFSYDAPSTHNQLQREGVLVVSDTFDVARSLSVMRPLADVLEHLVLTHTDLRSATHQRVLPQLRALPRLSRLTLAAVDPATLPPLAPLLAGWPQLSRLVIGLEPVHTGYDRWAPTQKDAKTWCGILGGLLCSAATSASTTVTPPLVPASTTTMLSNTAGHTNVKASNAEGSNLGVRVGEQAVTFVPAHTLGRAAAALEPWVQAAETTGLVEHKPRALSVHLESPTSPSPNETAAGLSVTFPAATAAAGLVSAAVAVTSQVASPPAAATQATLTMAPNSEPSSEQSLASTCTASGSTASLLFSSPYISTSDTDEPLPATVQLHIYMGVWCPASRIHYNALEHNPHYQELRQMLLSTGGSPASPGETPAGRVQLHECDNSSAYDMVMGKGGVWFERYYMRLMQLWDGHGPHKWDEQGFEYVKSDYDCCYDDVTLE